MGCLSQCSPDLTPADLGGCTPKFLSGGIRSVFFMKCDAEFGTITGQQITDFEAWETFVQGGIIVFSPGVLGSKPKGTTTTQRIQSCLPEVVTQREQTIQFRDYNADPDTLSNYDFWINKQENYSVLKFGYVSCEGLVYGPFNNGTWTIDLDDVREENVETKLYMDGTISVFTNLVKPVKVPGILTLIP